jgi:uncharacterized protein YyaL (SSP411 family)
MDYSFFHPTKETWFTSLRENKPIVFIFQDKLCPACFEFYKKVIADPNVLEYLYSHFIPIFLDINESPDIYVRYAEEEFDIHTTHSINGNLLGGCNSPDPSQFQKNLIQYKQVSLQALEEYQNPLPVNEVIPLIKEEAAKFKEKIELLSEITLSTLLSQYDSMYGGWLVQKHKIFPASALHFLLLLYQRSREKKLFEMLIQTLRATNRGLFDTQRGGFFESANRDWQMIYSYKKSLENNIAAARILFYAYQLTQDEYYLTKAQQTVNFCLNDLWVKEKNLFNYCKLDHPEYDLRYKIFLSKPNCDIVSLLIESKGVLKLPISDQEEENLILSATEQINKEETIYGIPHILRKASSLGQSFLLQDQDAYMNMFIQLYSYTGDTIYLQKAEKILSIIKSHYYDHNIDLFRDRAIFPNNDFGPLLKSRYPIRENSSMINNLITLSYLTEKSSYHDFARDCVISYYSKYGISRKLPTPPEFVIANQRLVESAIEIIIIRSKEDRRIDKLLNEIKRIYDPFKIIQILDPHTDRALIQKKNIKFEMYHRPVVYVKVGNMISPSIIFPKELARMLQTLDDAIKNGK